MTTTTHSHKAWTDKGGHVKPSTFLVRWHRLKMIHPGGGGWNSPSSELLPNEIEKPTMVFASLLPRRQQLAEVPLVSHHKHHHGQGEQGPLQAMA